MAEQDQIKRTQEQKKVIDEQIRKLIPSFTNTQQDELISLFHMQFNSLSNASSARIAPFMEQAEDVLGAVRGYEQRIIDLEEFAYGKGHSDPKEDPIVGYVAKVSTEAFDGADIRVVLVKDGFVTLDANMNYISLEVPINDAIHSALQARLQSEGVLAGNYHCQIFEQRQAASEPEKGEPVQGPEDIETEEVVQDAQFTDTNEETSNDQ